MLCLCPGLDLVYTRTVPHLPQQPVGAYEIFPLASRDLTGYKVDPIFEDPSRQNAPRAVMILGESVPAEALCQRHLAPASTLWALQIVNALHYPLLACTEWFATNDHRTPDDLRVTGFLRNEGLVTICSAVTKIILLVSAPQQQIRIGGIELLVTNVARGGEVPPLVPRDARDLIVGCLDCLVAHPVSLTDLMNRWAIARTTSQTIDWAEIDTYVTLLSNRYVRQEEVDVRAGGDRRTAWLPPAFRARSFGTDTLPPTQAFDGADEFDAGNAATALDHIVTDRQTADDYSFLSLGQWTNYAELATGVQTGVGHC
ncbi:hypothetical protein ACJJTC_010917 [Scirpophaga incertulas]